MEWGGINNLMGGFSLSSTIFLINLESFSNSDVKLQINITGECAYIINAFSLITKDNTNRD